MLASPPTQHPQFKTQEDYLVARLLDFFRALENETKWYQAAKIALNQITRSANNSTAKLDKRLVFFASSLKNNISPSSIRTFARNAIAAAFSVHSPDLSKNCNLNLEPKNLQKKVMKDLSKAINTGSTENSAVNRAANNLFQLKKSADQKLARELQASNHPLRETFQTLNINSKILAKEDIRNHLLNLKKYYTPNKANSGQLFNLLKKAQAFNPAHLHQLLGDDLFFLCRPLGFLDQKDETLIVEVPTNAHLHALTYRKLDILRALKQDKSFVNTKNIRFKVKNSLF